MKMLILSFVLMGSQAFAAASKVDFITPKNNETVGTTFPVEFKVEGMTVEKAGVMKKGTGHHHLIIDGKPIKKGMAVPKDETHIHYGDGATSTTVTLAPGKHTLTLQFADGAHLSMGPEYSKTITVEVK